MYIINERKRRGKDNIHQRGSKINNRRKQQSHIR